MINLAGNADCDNEIRCELERARIPAVDVPRIDHPDVKASVLGQLGQFRFQRLWYYYAVDGPVPLAVARELYADPVGRKDVRVAGHCGCPPPEHPWVRRYDVDRKQIALDPEGREAQLYRDFISLGLLTQDGFDRIHWVADAAAADAVTAEAYVETYHIDTEVGLRLFADAVRDLPRVERWELSP